VSGNLDLGWGLVGNVGGDFGMVHCKKRVAVFPSPERDVTAGDGKVNNLFLQCVGWWVGGVGIWNGRGDGRKGCGFRYGGRMGGDLGVKGGEAIFFYIPHLDERVAKMIENDRNIVTVPSTSHILAILKSKQTKIKFSSKDDLLAVCKIKSLQFITVSLLLFLALKI
jgi:hypothetical protein